MGVISEVILFNNEQFCDFKKHRLQEIENSINTIIHDDLLKQNYEEICETLYNDYKLQKMVLDIDNKIITHYTKMIQNDINYSVCNSTYLLISWKIPYTGDSHCFLLIPTVHTSDIVKAQIQSEYCVIEEKELVENLEKNPMLLNQRFTERLNKLNEKIYSLNQDIKQFNIHLKKMIKNIILEKRKECSVISRTLEVMNIPLKRNQDAPSIIPLRRKQVRPHIPSTKREKSYEILDEDYNHIINVIRHVGATFERARKTFCKLDEEELRDVILANLNGHYMGLATGETFRNSGKTDINIEFENRAAFVGECKVWQGEKIFHETIEQLIGYTTWKDTKNAMVFFNKKNKGFKAIQEKINELILKLEEYTKIDTKDGEWEFIINKDSNKKRIHVFLFDIYKGK